jgi:hypothetical protein
MLKRAKTPSPVEYWVEAEYVYEPFPYVCPVSVVEAGFDVPAAARLTGGYRRAAMSFWDWSYHVSKLAVTGSTLFITFIVPFIAE